MAWHFEKIEVMWAVGGEGRSEDGEYTQGFFLGGVGDFPTLFSFPTFDRVKKLE